MKTPALQAARVQFDHPDHPGTPYAPDYGDIYHAQAGAQGQAEHVFLGGNGLPTRRQGRARFVVLETGFGLGNNFLATWARWQADPARCEQLVFVSVEKHPLHAADLARAHAQSPHPVLAAELLAQWPPHTPDLHTLEFDGGRVRLLLAWGDLASWQSELVAQVDAFYLDGFSASRNPDMWGERLYGALARLAAPEATAATWSVAHALQRGLASAGFQVELPPGYGGKQAMCRARYAGLGGSGRQQLPPPGRRHASGARHALVIGAGLAGAAAARALLRDGLRVTVLEQHAEPAQETSGNPAGLFHGIVHAHDGAHAQLLRAAALRTAQVLRPLLAQGHVPGQANGLLRGTGGGEDRAAEPAHPPAWLDEQALPHDYVQWLGRDEASRLAGCDLPMDQWLFPGGGWVSPPALVRHWLSDPRLSLRTGQRVERLQATANGGWQALDGHGALLAEADVVVLACAHGLLPLLAGHGDDPRQWPLGRRRGQVTCLPPGHTGQLPHPALPLASGAYLISLPPSLGGGLLCGATSQSGDDDPQLRLADQRHNLAQLAKLVGHAAAASADTTLLLPGRVGWRLMVDDRLPLVGPVPVGPAERAGARRQEQPREVARVPGLYLLSGLGSRGLTLAPLLGEVLAAWISGAPQPLADSLLDAIDPARFVSRAVRQGRRSV